MRYFKLALVGMAAGLATPAAIYAQATSAADYVKMAGAGDQYEIQSSKLVLMSSKNPQVTKFANMMVTDHQKSTAEVGAAARSDKVMAGKPMLDADGRQMIAKLKAAKEPERDQMYLDQQSMAHQKALALHQSYASSGTSPSLMAAAGKIAPVVQTHIDMLSQIKSSM